MRCLSCGEDNPPEAGFCANCGAALEAAVEPPSPAASVRCNSCGQDNPPEASFCSNCGSTLATIEPPSPGAAPSSSAGLIKWLLIGGLAILMVVAIGYGVTSLFESPSPRPTPQPVPVPAPEVELKYDDGQPEARLSAAPNGGYLVDFSPSALPFTIIKVRMFGGFYGNDWKDKDFKVEIWDKDYQVVHSTIYSVAEFPVGVLSWSEVEVPNIRITDKFYVHIYTGTGRGQGIHIGADDSVVNEHSDVTVRTPEGVTEIRSDWPYLPGFWWSDKSKVNWMIRVVGEAETQ